MNRRMFVRVAGVFPFAAISNWEGFHGLGSRECIQSRALSACLVGDFARNGYNDDSANISIKRFAIGKYHVSGLAIWGTKRMSGPNIGEIDLVCELVDGKLVHKEYDPICYDWYQIEIMPGNGKLTVTEFGNFCRYGMNVTFDGEYQVSAH